MSLRATAHSTLAEVRDTMAMVRAVAKARMGRKGAPIDRSAPPLMMTVEEAKTLIGANDAAAGAWLEQSGLIVSQFGARRVHRDRLLSAWFGGATAVRPVEAMAPKSEHGEGIKRAHL